MIPQQAFINTLRGVFARPEAACVTCCQRRRKIRGVLRPVDSRSFY
jgi:hypothetical protein